MSNELKNLKFNAAALNELMKSPRNYQHADYQYEVIKEAISKFEASLDQEHEVALKLASFGQSIMLQITGLGYCNPSLIHFHGLLDDGSRAKLIQHVSQISFLLLAVKKSDPQSPPRRIGFLQDSDSDKDTPEQEL